MFLRNIATQHNMGYCNTSTANVNAFTTSDTIYCLCLFVWGGVKLSTPGKSTDVPWVKGPRREANRSPPTSTKAKKTWIYT
jgi:hypothetical protein